MQARGIFLTVLSAVLYGLNPLFSKTIFSVPSIPKPLQFPV